jgi:hypothetical protein
MRRALLVSLLVATVCALSASLALHTSRPLSAADEEKVLVCHGGKTTEIGASALQAHIDHGDTAGACEGQPTPEPTLSPTAEPTLSPTAEPTPDPTPTATPEPTLSPTPQPTPEPAETPTSEPTLEPTPTATPELSPTPAAEPTATATPSPAPTPTPEPTSAPTPAPTSMPESTPTAVAVAAPTSTPVPPATPTRAPIVAVLAQVGTPTAVASATPTASPTPSATPTAAPTRIATAVPTPVAGAPVATPTPDQENAARSSFADSFPSFLQLSGSPGTIATNLVLSLALLFSILMACTVFNQTLDENHFALAKRFAGVAAPFALWFGWLRREHDEGAGGGAGTWLRLGLILLTVGAIYSGLEPDFGLNQKTLALLVSLTLGVGLLTIIYEGSQILLSSRAFGARGRMELKPLGIVIAAIAVLVTRLTDLHPGIVLGVIAGAAVPLQDARREGQVVLGAMLGTLALSLVSLLLVGPFRSFADGSSEWYAVIPETVAVTLFIGGIEGLLLNLVPLQFMEGRILWRWSRLAWLLLASTVSFIFFHVVVNRTDAYTSVAEETGVQALVIICVVCVVLAGSFWLACRSLLEQEEVAEELARP